MNLTFQAVHEGRPGLKWQASWRRFWPGWKAWYDRAPREDAPGLAECERALRRYMPELLPVWHRLVELAGGDEAAARFLSFWSPPPYLAHCSQAVLVDDDGPVLVRNYDLDPALNEATILHSAWKGRRVIGCMEAIAGLADGINDRGLAASLNFGGRPVVGPGFGIPLILRYVLETCEDTGEAVEVLRRVPSHMAYNLILLDRHGTHATVLVAPDRPTIVTRDPAITNHQLRVEWPEQARFSRTAERKQWLDHLLAQPGLDAGGLVAAFLEPPLLGTDYARGFATVYTAAYRPLDGSLTLHWPNQAPWRHSFRDPAEGRRTVIYDPDEAERAALARQQRERRLALSAGPDGSSAGFACSAARRMETDTAQFTRPLP